jgi:hypothetical protein
VVAQMIKGIDVVLYEKTKVGVDAFNAPVYADKPVMVKDVLVCPSTSQEILDSTNLYGKKAVYTLAIPKGDNHDWSDATISFFGKKWKSFGIPSEGISEMIPLRWNKKVMVERYE